MIISINFLNDVYYSLHLYFSIFILPTVFIFLSMNLINEFLSLHRAFWNLRGFQNARHAAIRHAATSPNIYNNVIVPSVLT